MYHKTKMLLFRWNYAILNVTGLLITLSGTNSMRVQHWIISIPFKCIAITWWKWPTYCNNGKPLKWVTNVYCVYTWYRIVQWIINRLSEWTFYEVRELFDQVCLLHDYFFAFFSITRKRQKRFRQEIQGKSGVWHAKKVPFGIQLGTLSLRGMRQPDAQSVLIVTSFAWRLYCFNDNVKLLSR